MITEMFYVLLLVVAAAYLSLTSTYGYWKKKGVKYARPVPFFGNAWEFFVMRKTTGQIFQKFYCAEEFKSERVFGIFLGRRPCLVVKDLDLIKDVLIKDFDCFADRAISSNPKIPLNSHLFNLTGWRWRTMRKKLTPAFTSGNMKLMFNIMSECAQQLDSCLKEPTRRGDVVEIKNIMSSYMIDVIGTCAFGLQLNSLENPDCEFKKMSTLIFQRSFMNGMKRAIMVTMPGLAKYLSIALINTDVNDYFLKIFVDAMNFRIEHSYARNDFLHLLMELKRNGSVCYDGEPGTETGEDGKCVLEWTDEHLAAQALIFLLAGFDNSASTMSFALCELAMNLNIQEKLAKEIRTSIENNDGVITYEMVAQMKYLDMVVSETLRMYTPTENLVRKVTKPYQIEGTKIILDENTRVFIPVAAIHRDPFIYPQPDRFDPERFAADGEDKRHPMAFLPFGGGPRHCIGTRFATLAIKIGLCTVLNKYIFELCDGSLKNSKMDARGFNAHVMGGMRFRLKNRPVFESR